MWFICYIILEAQSIKHVSVYKTNAKRIMKSANPSIEEGQFCIMLILAWYYFDGLCK